MKILFLISDDYVWAPPVLNNFLKDSKPYETVGVIGVPGISNHRDLFSFVFIYLKLLYPWLFIRRALQSLRNRFSASRGKTLSSVQQVAAFHKIPFERFRDINDSQTREWISSLSPDVLISIQPQYIKKPLQSLVPYFINIHAGKLPGYRGPAAIFWVLYFNEKETAVTAHFVNEKFDDGEIICEEIIPITKDDTYYTLGEKITKAMPGVLKRAIGVVERGGPYKPNLAFEGCYRSYPRLQESFKFYFRQFWRSLKKVFTISKQEIRTKS